MVVPRVANHMGSKPGPVYDYSDFVPFNETWHYHSYCPINDWTNHTEVRDCGQSFLRFQLVTAVLVQCSLLYSPSTSSLARVARRSPREEQLLVGCTETIRQTHRKNGWKGERSARNFSRFSLSLSSFLRVSQLCICLPPTSQFLVFSLSVISPSSILSFNV